MKKYIFAAICVSLLATSCKDFLVKENPNSIDSEFYFADETSLQIYTNGFCRTYSPSMYDVISGDHNSDACAWDSSYKFLTSEFSQMDQTSWSWTNLRSINYYLANMGKANCEKEVMDHYRGVGYFFRAMFYIDKFKTYGSVPLYNKVLEPDDKEALYQPRAKRSEVAEFILKDLDSAVVLCSAADKYMNRATVINKYIAATLKARFCLFEGTYRIYHNVDPSTKIAWTADEKAQGTKYLQECVKACEIVMNSGKFKLIDDPAKRATQYRNMFICDDACGTCTQEWIWATDYDAGTNIAQKSYGITDYLVNAQHSQFMINRDFLMTYLMLDGTPFTTKYKDFKDPKGTKTGPLYVDFATECKDRDYRLAQTVRTPGFVREGGTVHYAPDLFYTKTGLQPVKYLIDKIDDQISSAIYTDAPIMRYAEVLLSWAEAKAELGTFTDADWAKSVGLVRARAGVDPKVPADKDPYMKEYFLNTVDNKYILEIRRERGCELVLEDIRQDDDMRWAMGALLCKQKTGIYIPAIEQDLDLDGDGKMDNIVSKVLNEKTGVSVLQLGTANVKHSLSDDDHGYILPATDIVKTYKWEEKKYVRPIPNVSVTMNDKLGQNADW